MSIEGIRDSEDLEFQKQAIQKLARSSWGLLDSIATDSSSITRDSLPVGYGQIYINGSDRKVFYNINNSITFVKLKKDGDADELAAPDGSTLGDVLSYDGSNYARKPIGAANQVFRVSSGEGAWTGATLSEAFTSNGTFTAPDGVNSVWVSAVGGGGGGGGGSSGAGGGGGSSAYSYRTIYKVTAGLNYTITVGAAGTAGENDADGGNGAQTIFNGPAGTITCAPGSGGKSGANGSTGGAAGAAGSGSDLDGADGDAGGAGGGILYPNIIGGAGGDGVANDGGGGGGSIFGAGGAGGIHPGTNPGAGSYGAGGGGALFLAGRDGAAGGAGYVLVEWS